MTEITARAPANADDAGTNHPQLTAAEASSADNASLLAAARSRAEQHRLGFSGSIVPPDAWRLIQTGAATLVDVRTAEERKFVGYVPDSLHVAWMTGISLNRNPRFVKEVETKIKDKSALILLLCRSGKRSSAAAEALAKSGFVNVFNIEEGFEGEINAHDQRGFLGGWRSYSLPWIQD